MAGNPAGDQTWELDARNIMVRAGSRLHAELPGEPQLLLEPPSVDPQLRRGRRLHHANSTARLEPEKNTDYFGEGFYQRISTHHAHQQFDWIINNNLLNHSTVAYDRWFMGGNSLSAGVDWPQRLWGAKQGGLLNTTAARR